MGKTKGPHHRGTFPARSARIRQAAYANPDTRCWRCGRTLPQIRAIKPRAHWTAGHLPGYDGIPDAPLAPECSSCNYSHGATIGNRKRGRRRPQPPIYRAPSTSEAW